MDPTIWVIAGATLVGPILAVQAQKWLERLRERRARKLYAFQALMTTRATRLSTDHVQALNSLDLVFYGERVLGIPLRTKTEQAVLDSWRDYLDHLNTQSVDGATWFVRGDELFINLLSAMATDLRMKFDRVHLRRGAYVPVAHGRLEQDQEQIRRALLQLLGGTSAIRVLLTDPSQVAAQSAPVSMLGTHTDPVAASGGGAPAPTDKRTAPPGPGSIGFAGPAPGGGGSTAPGPGGGGSAAPGPGNGGLATPVLGRGGGGD